mmetsp:Transcript_74578/g.210932  ORF Transcript_74578/g.210932 Transcript_74578/m.210932 type:complete len:114 (+) Transcript_74578:97-438(+)
MPMPSILRLLSVAILAAVAQSTMPWVPPASDVPWAPSPVVAAEDNKSSSQRVAGSAVKWGHAAAGQQAHSNASTVTIKLHSELEIKAAVQASLLQRGAGWRLALSAGELLQAI